MMPRSTYRNKAMDWASALQPQRCEICGRMVMPSAMESLYQMGGQLYGPLFQGLSQMYGGLLGGMMGGRGAMGQYGYGHRHHHHHNHECDCEGGCPDCGRDDCHCRCCISDADLVVYARLGEQRLVPISIENSGRRERNIKLNLSDWSTHGGRTTQVQVKGSLQDTEFTLAACEERQVLLGLQVSLAGEPVTPGRTPGSAAGQPEAQQRQLPDVDDCTVLYADLRVDGCDIRPIRIALSLLPRDCGAYQVDCRCSCC